MTDEIRHELSLLKELVAIDTDSNLKSNYTEIASALKGMLKEVGAKVTIVSPQAKDKKPRPNVIGYINNNSPNALAINCHYDVVPVARKDWRTDPFSLVIKGDKAYGRGSNDDKGSIAITLGAIKDAKKCNVNLELYFTCDEETGSELGMQYIAEHERERIKAQSALVLDGESTLEIGCSGGIAGKITFKGKEAHGGMPFKGINPIDKSLVFLNRLNDFKKICEKTVSNYYGDPERKVYNRFTITMIHSGIKENLVPGSLEARFDLRVIPESNVATAVGAFKRYFDEVKKETGIDAVFETVYEHEASITSENVQLVKRMKEITGQERLFASFGGDDGSFFRHAGVPAVSYGVFNSSGHGANEYVSLKEMAKVKGNVIALLESY